MPDSRPPRSTWLVRFLAVLAAYYVGGRIGLTVPYVGSHISLIWPPTGIALAALLRWELSLWPAVWLGAFGVNLAVGGSPLLAFGIACGNTLGPWLAARELRRRKFDPRLPRRHDLLLYLGIGVLGGMAINASNGVLQLWLAELLPAPAIGAAWGTWWLGDAMGALVMGIPLLTASREGWHALIFGRRGRELLVLMLLTVGLGAWVFEGHAAAMPANPLLYLPFFLLSWLAIRGGANLASTAALLLSAQAVWATAQGGGPFQSPDLHLSLAMLWGYMATATVITVLITVLVDELRTSERRLTLATMGGQLGLWEWHLPTDKVTYAGDFHAVLGVASERRDAGAGAVFARVHPEDRDLLEQRLAAHLAGATRFFEAEYRIQEHQRTTWVQARGQVVERDAAGAPVRMAGTLLDVSDRKQSEAAFAKESHKREALLHAASDGIHVLDSRGRVLEASDSFCEMLGYARGELLGMHVSQWDAQWSAEELDERILPRLHEERSTFETQHRCRDGRVFDAEISTIGVDIDGERLLYCSARDITGRKRAEHDMRESRTRMRALLDACDESVMLLTPEGRLLAINAFGAERFGMPPERMLGQDFLALLPPDLADTRRTSLAETVASAGPVHLQDQRDGIFFDVSLYPVMDESGKVESIAVYAKDVTERKEAEEALRRSEERWKFALEGAEAGVYDWNVETGAVFFSTRAREVLGFREDEHILTLAQWESRLHPLDMPRRRSALHEHLDGHKPIYVCEYRYRTATRGWKWILARGIVAEHTADGRPLRMIGTFIDIDAQRRSAKADALRSRALEMLAQGGELKSIFDTVIIGLEEEDPSFGFAVLLVDDDGQFSIGSAPGLLFTPQSERFELSGKISAGGRVAVLGEPLVLDIPDAAYLRSVEAIAASAEVEFCWSEPLMLAPEKTGGALLAFRRNAEEAHLPKIETLQHTAQLISIALQRKHADAQLQLASSVYEASGEAIIVVDGDNRIIAVNPAFSHLTGYAAFEVLGKDPKILKSGRNDEAYYRRMWQALNDTGQWQDEMWNRRKDGQEFAEWLTINTIHDAQGKVMRRVAIFSDITERKRSEDIIWRQANYDALTSLPNRRLFRDRLDQEVDKARRTSGTAFLALLFIDLDRFKDVNDTLGHEVGDRLLIEAAQRIGACVRSSDTVARLGGDEFTVILPAMDETSRVEQVAQAIIRALSNPFRLGAKEPVYISASVGITLYPGDAEDSQTLLKTADQAMYAAKNQGRNRFSYFTQSLQDAAQSRLQINNDLWFALARNQFELYYQPILELASGRIVKAEALLRWRHPERGMISPAEFIPLAEENGLITDIGDWVFRQAALAARRWRDLGQRDIKVSVNKSPRQFQAGNTQEAWPEFLNEIGLSAECLVIEITEGLLLENRPEVAEKLLAFRDAGIEIALDDFGTGYSAMSYLKKFHIDYLKIDQSFVRDMGHDPADRAIAEAIIVMAHKLGLKVIAEGVETIAQRDLLTTAGCDYGQGYLFARPLPAAEFEALLTAHVPVGLAQD